MGKILIFAGTVEGRRLAEFLDSQKKECYVCVATEYGESLLPEGEYICSSSKRLSAKEMKELMNKEGIDYVVDATHPFAVEVSENIRFACETLEKKYIRLLRDEDSIEEKNDCILVGSVGEAVDYLMETDGNILVTTGSKELKEYTRIPQFKKRVTARVLSTPEVVMECSKFGFEGKNLICMQGPFDEELNYCLLKQTKASYLVTKESGKAGGLEEKLIAAKRAGVKVILIGRPKEQQGYSFEQVKLYLCKEEKIKWKQHITFVGIGMGTKQTMTLEAWNACEMADVLIGAERMLQTVKELRKPKFSSYKIEEIKQFISEHLEYGNIVILVSGDIGFYSGTKKWMEQLSDYPISRINGISSVVYFCGKLGIPWEKTALISLHGREQNIIHAVKNNETVFSLVGEDNGIPALCKELIRCGLESVVLHVGENLSYSNERIVTGTPKELVTEEFERLSVVVIENRIPEQVVVTHGIRDEKFLRDKVPMTKSEIRSISLSKLELTREATVYDIGAGTGSVSIELSMQAFNGMVYAVEKKEEAVNLIQLNKNYFGVSNLQIIEGEAPDALKELPAPSHVFIGGSSGNLKEILASVLKKNPSVRIVMNAITLETVMEAVECVKEFSLVEVDIASVAVSKSKEVGQYHMMMAQNPVYIISCRGGGSKENGTLS